MNRDIVIIGAGQAGYEAARVLRQKGHEGAVTIVGDEPEYPYERPPLSKAYLKGELEKARLYFRKPEFYAEKDITLRSGIRVEALDRMAKEVVLEGGARLSYDKLLIATGSRVRHLPVPGADLDRVFYVKTIAESEALRAALKEATSVAIIGGGFIGLEVASAARAMGKAVTVIEALPRVMARVVSEPVSHFYEELHRGHGVEMITGAAVEAITGEARATGVRLADGREIATEAVVVGIGTLPDMALAEAAGLETENGICVDARCCTSDPDIFAAGDCTSFTSPPLGRRVRLESVANAVSQGRVAALNMLEQEAVYDEVPWFWSDQNEVKLQMAGLSDAGDTPVVRGDPADGAFSVLYLRAGRLAAIDCVNMLKDFVPAKKAIAEGRVIDVARAADATISIKEL